MKKYLYLTISTFVIIGCGGGSFDTSSLTNENNSNEPDRNYDSTRKTININSSDQIAKISKTGDSKITLNIDSPKDIYVVVTSHNNNQDVSISSPSATSDIEQNSRVTTKTLNSNKNKTPQKVLDFRKNASNLLHKNRDVNNSKTYKIANTVSSVNEGDSFRFCTDMDSNYNCSEYVDAKAKKVVKNISTKYGNKNLVVWVSNDEYNDGSFTSSGSITQSMVDKLADTFLQNSDNNGYDDDIYDWDTNIFGEEWGDDASRANSNLIPNNDTVNILIYNMNTDGLAGYFWAKDNFKKSDIQASNEKIMFYINSQLYAQDEKETFTTLAHEFQHMIHFYRRTINNISDDTWFDEMMSEATEDLVATKLKYHGPRNVDYRDGSAGYSGNSGGRYPGFNEKNTRPLTAWYNDVYDYSKVSSFGAFLLRNYGGANVLHDLMYSQYSNESAVVNATGESSFEDLLNKWAEGVILSDVDDLDSSKPRYNFGDFKYTTYRGVTYKLGSINFFNYSPTPTMKKSDTLNRDANLYYKVGNGKLSGKVKIDVNIEKGGDIIIIAK